MLAEERAAWLEERRKGIGGSDIASVVGRGFSTARRIWEEKLGIAPEEPASLAMRRGLALEPIVLDEYQRKTKRTLAPPPGLIRHPDIPYAAATLDGITEDLAVVVQAKTADWAYDWGTPGTDEVPDAYLIQVNWETLVASGHYGRPIQEAHIPLWVSGERDIRLYRVVASPRLQEALVRAGREFWEHVQNRTPPHEAEPIEMELDGKQRVTVQADTRVLGMVARLREIQGLLRPLEGEKDVIREYLKAYMGGADTLLAGAQTVATYRTSKAGTRSLRVRQTEERHG